jgi:hypothetical protein
VRNGAYGVVWEGGDMGPPQGVYEFHHQYHGPAQFYGQPSQRQHPKGGQRRNQNRNYNRPKNSKQGNNADLQGSSSNARSNNKPRYPKGYKTQGMQGQSNQFPQQYGYQHNNFKNSTPPSQPYQAKGFKQNQVYQQVPQGQQFGGPYGHPMQFSYPPYPYYPQAQYRAAPPMAYYQTQNAAAFAMPYPGANPEQFSPEFSQEYQQQSQQANNLQQFPNGSPDPAEEGSKSGNGDEGSKPKASSGSSQGLSSEGNRMTAPYHGYGNLPSGPQQLPPAHLQQSPPPHAQHPAQHHGQHAQQAILPYPGYVNPQSQSEFYQEQPDFHHQFQAQSWQQ